MTQYSRGYRVENDVVNLYKEKDWYAARIAGSHTCMDVFACRAGEMHFIQCSCRKQGKTRKDLDVLIALAKENNARAFHAYREKGIQIVEVSSEA